MKTYTVHYTAKSHSGNTYKGIVKVKNCFSELHAKSKTEDHVKRKLGLGFASISFGIIYPNSDSIFGSDIFDIFK